MFIFQGVFFGTLGANLVPRIFDNSSLDRCNLTLMVRGHWEVGWWLVGCGPPIPNVGPHMEKFLYTPYKKVGIYGWHKFQESHPRTPTKYHGAHAYVRGHYTQVSLDSWIWEWWTVGCCSYCCCLLTWIFLYVFAKSPTIKNISKSSQHSGFYL